MTHRRVATLLCMAVAVFIGVAWNVVRNDGEKPSAEASAESIGGDSDPTTTSESTSTVPPDGSIEMGERYRECVLNAGFDPDMVQVLLDPAGVPQWVKTGYEVPAEFHVPCFRSIGGTLNENWSSYGNER